MTDRPAPADRPEDFNEVMEPRTEAGRRLLRDAESWSTLGPAAIGVFRDAILAIEDEAAASPVLDDMLRGVQVCIEHGHYLSVKDARAALSEVDQAQVGQ